ncbi:hypothetical protein FPQ18DRAFT_374878 [Pyronema domesticum]|uniref:Uncharacterized protein n=1 Tax=Pyronema omphalodes (strain CBS 100304) TaxID=1076935 RepID=U4LLF3_PYROM|nr:hypothetical protein FPQ18DRAFT_374878 [Pyronema domesticum]CCX32949.1 Protein of unknown function [Pyronema omphalodes CBS 100304]
MSFDVAYEQACSAAGYKWQVCGQWNYRGCCNANDCNNCGPNNQIPRDQVVLSNNPKSPSSSSSSSSSTKTPKTTPTPTPTPTPIPTSESTSATPTAEIITKTINGQPSQVTISVTRTAPGQYATVTLGLPPSGTSTSTPQPATSGAAGSGPKSSTWALPVGIAIGVVALLAMILALFLIIRRRRQRQRQREDIPSVSINDAYGAYMPGTPYSPTSPRSPGFFKGIKNRLSGSAVGSPPPPAYDEPQGPQELMAAEIRTAELMGDAPAGGQGGYGYGGMEQVQPVAAGGGR